MSLGGEYRFGETLVDLRIDYDCAGDGTGGIGARVPGVMTEASGAGNGNGAGADGAGEWRRDGVRGRQVVSLA